LLELILRGARAKRLAAASSRMLLYSEGCLETHFGIVVAALEQLRYIAKLPVIMQIPLKLANGSKAKLFDSSRRI